MSRKFQLYSAENITCYIVSALIVSSVILVIVIVSTTSERKGGGKNFKSPTWAYRCESNKCIKDKYDPSITENMGLVWCRQTCMDPNHIDIWPRVLRSQRLNDDSRKYFKIKTIKFRENNSENEPNHFWQDNYARFYNQLENEKPKQFQVSDGDFEVIVDISVTSNNINLTMETDEAYTLEASKVDNVVCISIMAETVFGSRHALETLVQMIFYDDFSNTLVIHCGLLIEDAPVYKHRGLALDTSRNYFSVESIKRNIDAMAMVKLNVFHWHITDSHSWPMQIKSHIYLTEQGAYEKAKIYTSDDITEIVEYAYIRGIRVIPELDAPAHVGEGWQSTEYVTCFKKQPWVEYCYEPPCGQFNPTIDNLYDVLEDIYKEMVEMFKYPDLFHMGGDEIHFKCWESSDNLTSWMTGHGWNLDDDGYMRLWSYFQNKALERLDKSTISATKIILWTSKMTEREYLHYLDSERYVIQVWTDLDDPNVKNLLENNFKVIISNSDVMYLDCGYEAWTGYGNNWCSPYSGWQHIYSNDFKALERYKSQILGAEAPLWSEQVDEMNLDGRLWPRGIALAERLWSDPTTSYLEAEPRILLQRQRFVENGLSAEAVQPQWCLQNQGECPIN